MKRIVLTIFAAFLLSACGGGGGAAPSVNLDDSRITATELRAEVEELRKNLGDTPDERRLATKLSELESDIDNARREFKVLLDEIAELRAEWNRIKTADISPPPPPNCGTNEEPNGRNCECVAGYVRQNGVCELPPPNCGTNEEPNGRNCECVAGYVRQNGVCELPPPNCGTNEEPNGRNCECVAGYVRQNGVCELPPPNCGTNEEPNGRNCECISGYVRQNGVCELPPPNCGTNEEPNGRNCECVSGYVRQNGMCELPPCTDFRERNAEGECTYDTPEYRENNRALATVQALYAYERGYHGQGVTVVVGEQVTRTHENLRENVLTMDIGLDCRNFAGSQNEMADWQKYNCDRFNEADAEGLAEIYGQTPEYFMDLIRYHGDGAAGIIAAPRNGIKMHGVAPQAKLIPINNPGAFRNNDDRSDLQYIIDNKIPIVSYSIAGVGTGAQFDRDYSLFADTDTVLVWAGGNNRKQIPKGLLSFRNGLPDRVLGLEDNWLVAVALSASEAVWTIHCGEIKMWCITAPGWSITTPGGPDNDDYFELVILPGGIVKTYTTYTASSAATPFVSGALALLKSAAPEFPMTVIRPILLTTATDAGDPGIDEEFGWGIVNISAGIEHIENLETVAQDGIPAINLSDLRMRMPSDFAHLVDALADISVAFEITENSFYNAPLTAFLQADETSGTKTGEAAAKLLAADSLSPENAGFGFNYAGGDYSLRYADGDDSFRYAAEVLRYGEDGTFAGANFGALGAASSRTTGGKVRAERKLFGGISAFGEYDYRGINANMERTGLISDIRDATAEGWEAGLSFADIFRLGDRIRLSAREEARISGGEMILRYPVADGDFYDAFLGKTPQTIRTETARIPIKQKPQTIWTLGYSQQTDNGKWSAATEWNLAKNESAFSFAVELQIR